MHWWIASPKSSIQVQLHLVKSTGTISVNGFLGYESCGGSAALLRRMCIEHSFSGDLSVFLRLRLERLFIMFRSTRKQLNQ